jgi:hypothetical protein
MSRPKQLYWIGGGDPHGRHFGAVPGVREAIPARDLTPEETADLTEAQWEAIDSPTGRLLYRRTEPTEETKTDTATSPSANTAAKSAESSS